MVPFAGGTGRTVNCQYHYLTTQAQRPTARKPKWLPLEEAKT